MTIAGGGATLNDMGCGGGRGGAIVKQGHSMNDVNTSSSNIIR